MSLRLAIYGASGLTGSEVLSQAINHAEVEIVYSIGRKQLGIESSKLIQIVTKNQQIIDEIELPEVDVVICCLGTTIKKAGSQEAFKEIDVNIPVRIARRAKNKQVHTFIVQSSIGAGEGAKGFYLRCKTEMENEVENLGFQSTYILRPSLLTGKRKEFRFAERVSEALLMIVKPLLLGRAKKYRAISVNDVANALLKCAFAKTVGLSILESDEIQNTADVGVQH